MITVREDATILGVSELRTRAADVVAELEKHRVILTKRNKPVGVIIDYDEYEAMSALLEELEDLVLSDIAVERKERKGAKYVTLAEAEEAVGLK